MKLIHGGDIAGYIQTYGRAPVDFSANISPLGLPAGVKAAVIAALDQADRYPDPLCRELTAAIGAAHQLPQEYVLCGNGAADLIVRLAWALRPRRALLPAPTFAEYEQALATVGCAVEHHLLEEQEAFALTPRFLEQLDASLDVVFLCNPNNPTGQTIAPALLEEILARCARLGITVVVDECFQEFLEEEEAYSLAGRLGDYPNLVILRAFTKSYAMAGLRLGYLLCSDPRLIQDLRAAGQPWAVSSVAQAAGLAALADPRYLMDMRELVSRERRFMKEQLAARGIEAIGSRANYLFFHQPVEQFQQRLEREGILLRSCDNYIGLPPGYCRAAVRTHPENEQLLAALDRLLEERL